MVSDLATHIYHHLLKYITLVLGSTRISPCPLMSPKLPPPATTLYITFDMRNIYLRKSVKHLSTHSSHLVWTIATAFFTAILLNFLLVFNVSRIVRQDLFIFLLDSLIITSLIRPPLAAYTISGDLQNPPNNLQSHSLSCSHIHNISYQGEKTTTKNAHIIEEYR